MSLQVTCNALWFITNQHAVIQTRSMREKNVMPVPSCFSEYQGFNEMKRKKLKEQPMSSTVLNAHAEALFSVLQKPIMQSSNEWKKLHDDLSSLAVCLLKYSEFLNRQAQYMQEIHESEKPRRNLEDSLVEYRPASNHIDKQYSLIDAAVVSTSEPVFFDERIHSEGFVSSVQRHRFIQNMHLSVPIDIFKYSPGGSHITSYVIVKVKENRSPGECLTAGSRLLSLVKDDLKVFHTRKMRQIFQSSCKNIASMTPSAMEFIYKTLALDSTVSAHKETHERLRLIFLGDDGIIADLRHLNCGRPTTTFDVFFAKLAENIDNVTAEDDRRHGVAHLARWISLSDMISETAAELPSGTPIPSKALVRLQFTPRNKYIHNALNFTSKLPVTYKIQRRQLRANHVDQHFCNALFRYLKHRAVELGPDCTMFCCDDKAKIPVGEPGVFVSTGVRGKKSIAPTTSVLGALDHDMTKCSVTPSVYFKVLIPDTVDQSFYRGIMYVSVNDSVFQTSSPFRHAASLVKVMGQAQNYPKILLRFTDGGVDQRNTLESVKMSNISLFKDLDLDMLIHVRCAPGQSWTNPAERCMALLNLGLQNCALSRDKCHDEEVEKVVSSANSMRSVREQAEKTTNLKEQWLDAVSPVQAKIVQRFSRLKIKLEPSSYE